MKLDRPGANIRAGLTVWGLPIPMLIGSTILSVPTLILLFADRRRVRKDDLKQVIRLAAFYRRLKSEGMANCSARSALFLDEGVVFALAKLRADKRASKSLTASGPMAKWEKNALDKWSKMLNAIVWLDAPDDLLIKRIRSRAKKHRMKDRPDNEIHEFLKRYRTSYKEIIDELKTRSDEINILKFRTDEASLDRMARDIVALINATDGTVTTDQQMH
jgi:hypothetical protein